MHWTPNWPVSLNNVLASMPEMKRASYPASGTPITRTQVTAPARTCEMARDWERCSGFPQ